MKEAGIIIARCAEAREAHPQARSCSAYRVVNGAADGAPPGLVVDRYADAIVISARAELDDGLVEGWCEAAQAALEPRAIVLKRPARPASRSTTGVWAGALDESPVLVDENGARFLCVLDEGQSTGLFLDQRDARSLVRERAAGRTVLNLFAHTCAFSVHAALGGAARVTSVDSARAALHRGRDNMVASGLDPDRHRWFPDDVRSHLERARRKGVEYGLIVLDPPMFGRAGARVHALRGDLAGLITLASGLMEVGGLLLVSTHALELGMAELEALARSAADEAGRAPTVEATLGAPAWDHPPLARTVAGDRGDYLKTLVLRFG